MTSKKTRGKREREREKRDRERKGGGQIERERGRMCNNFRKDKIGNLFLQRDYTRVNVTFCIKHFYMRRTYIRIILCACRCSSNSGRPNNLSVCVNRTEKINIQRPSYGILMCFNICPALLYANSNESSTEHIPTIMEFTSKFQKL